MKTVITIGLFFVLSVSTAFAMAKLRTTPDPRTPDINFITESLRYDLFKSNQNPTTIYRGRFQGSDHLCELRVTDITKLPSPNRCLTLPFYVSIPMDVLTTPEKCDSVRGLLIEIVDKSDNSGVSDFVFSSSVTDLSLKNPIPTHFERDHDHFGLELYQDYGQNSRYYEQIFFSLVGHFDKDRNLESVYSKNIDRHRDLEGQTPADETMCAGLQLIQ